MHFITISRQSGSLGDEIAGLLSQKLSMELIDHDFVFSEWLPEVAGKYELHMLGESPKFYLNKTNKGLSFAEFIETRLKETVELHQVIIVGLGAQIIFSNNTNAIKIRIIASNNIRIKRLMEIYKLDGQDAEKLLDLSDRRHKRYISTVFEKDWSDPSLYDFVVNTDKLTSEDAAEMLYAMMESHIRQEAGSSLNNRKSNTGESSLKSKPFKHPAEEEFAKILDMYKIQWEYEPRTFPIEWDADGNIKMAFTPDFYLPRFDTYIELTTMEQKYVTIKNKKVRRLKEMYPGTKVKIVFKNDYNALIKRFGLNKNQRDIESI
jgi:cytidylate kinase